MYWFRAWGSGCGGLGVWILSFEVTGFRGVRVGFRVQGCGMRLRI